MMPLTRTAFGGSLAAIGGLLLLFLWLAIDGPWADRGRTADPWNWVVAAGLLIVGVGVLVWSGRLSSFDVLVNLIGTALIANMVLAVAASGHLNCLIGPEPAVKPAKTALVTLPTKLLERAADVKPDGSVRLVLVARHHKADNEEVVETTTYKGIYRESPSVDGTAPAKPMIEIERGADDKDLAAFLGALSDAETIVLFDRATSAAEAASTGCF